MIRLLFVASMRPFPAFARASRRTTGKATPGMAEALRKPDLLPYSAADNEGVESIKSNRARLMVRVLTMGYVVPTGSWLE